MFKVVKRPRYRYISFFHANSFRNITDTRQIFKNKKNFYRRYRDLSIFCMIAVYLLSIVDAYVDAELSSFDISKDLGLQVEPAIFNFGRRRGEAAVGIQCNLNF